MSEVTVDSFFLSAKNRCGNVSRSLYEGFCMSFLTSLSRGSYPFVRKVIISYILPENTAKDIISYPLSSPSSRYRIKLGKN